MLKFKDGTQPIAELVEKEMYKFSVKRSLKITKQRHNVYFQQEFLFKAGCFP